MAQQPALQVPDRVETDDLDAKTHGESDLGSGELSVTSGEKGRGEVNHGRHGKHGNERLNPDGFSSVSSVSSVVKFPPSVGQAGCTDSRIRGDGLPDRCYRDVTLVGMQKSEVQVNEHLILLRLRFRLVNTASGPRRDSDLARDAEVQGRHSGDGEVAWASRWAGRTGRRRRKMWCQSWVATTQVRPRSMMTRLGVIAGSRACAARSRSDAVGVEVAGRARATRGSGAGRPRPGGRVRGTPPTGWRGTSSWAGWRSAAASVRAATWRSSHLSVNPCSLYSGAIERAERDHVVVEERVPRLDRRVHRHAVPLGEQQQAGQHHLVADVERLVQRVPTA